MDITDYADLHASAKDRISTAATFPTTLTQSSKVTPLLSKLSQTNIQSNLQTFTN